MFKQNRKREFKRRQSSGFRWIGRRRDCRIASQVPVRESFAAGQIFVATAIVLLFSGYAAAQVETEPGPETNPTGQTEPDQDSTAPQQPDAVNPERQTDPSLETPAATDRDRVGFDKQGAIIYRRGEDFHLTLDYYVPDTEGPHPAIIAIHGGAWRSGSKIHMLRHARRLAGFGYVVVAINYRHAPEHPWPAQIHDAKLAVRWIRKNAERYKVDPERIGAFGYSAGGHLSAMLATTGDDPEFDGEVPEDLQPFSTAIDCAVCGGAPCEFSWFADNSRSLAYWLGDSPANIPDVYLRASPTTHADATDAPVYLFHGKRDLVVPLSTSREMEKTLNEIGIENQRVVIEGQGHIAAFTDMDNLNNSLEFLDRHLNNGAYSLNREEGTVEKKRAELVDGGERSADTHHDQPAGGDTGNSGNLENEEPSTGEPGKGGK